MDPRLRFLLKFFAAYAVFQFLILAADLSALEKFITQTVAGWLNLPFDGNVLVSSSGSWAVNAQCTGLVSASILAALVLSLKKPSFPLKLLTLGIGTVLLLVLNVFRVAFVVWAGMKWNLAEPAHVISWMAMTAFIIGIWYAFNRYALKIRNFEGFI
ncbi:MAG: archaeosortase/exosortase family protein [Candidatus Diapherotrites archaeon]|nr:archaeosortase/exosortase family protein [Candidatus Diapherotrites archaeon]